MKAIIRRLQKLEGQLAANKEEQAAAELLREWYRRYMRARLASSRARRREQLPITKSIVSGGLRRTSPTGMTKRFGRSTSDTIR
jgi:hypothetical protein